MTELVLHTSPDPDALASAFVASTAVPGDPFARPLVLVPGAGTARWLSQRVAVLSGAGHGEGISAGLDTHPVSALEELFGGMPPADDPWAPERLVWAILATVDEGADPRLEPLARHLAANDQRYANALRVARLLGRYADHRPELVRRWNADDEAGDDLGFDGWQVALWRSLGAALRAPDPVRRRDDLASALASGRRRLPWPVAHVFAPRHVSAALVALLRAAAAQLPVHVWLPTVGPSGGAHPVGAALGRRGRAWRSAWEAAADHLDELPGRTPPATALGRLQAAVHAGVDVDAPTVEAPTGRAAPGDVSVAIHASHGPARQVEVLREALTGAFADDPTLEPRHVVVVCPDPAALAPHLAAAFAAPPGDAGSLAAHPGTQLRVQVAEAPAAAANLLYGLLVELIRLGSTRATASQLLALATHPFVARRFGLDADDALRLEELLDRAGVRWGINPAHRERFGLGAVQQNTWQLGVQRLALGEALSSDPPASVGVVATVDDVASTDTELVGALAELVSRVSRIVRACAAPATIAAWVDRLRDAVASLTEVPFTEAWQLSQLWAALDALASRGRGSAAELGAADAIALLEGEFAWRVSRPAYGNGSLVVCSLEALARVPHRVVCVVGLDERTFPRRGVGDGDDLLRRSPRPDDPDPGSDDRQLFLDAVLAATERLIVVYQGHSAHTNESYPAPAGVLELIEHVGEAAVRHEPLQSFAPANFTAAGPRSFDQIALRAARAAAGPRRPAPDRWEVGHVHRSAPLTTLDLTDLGRLLRHPGQFWLRQRASLTIGEDEPIAEELPLEVGPLALWQIGDRMLAALRAGQPLEPLLTAEWLSGDLPPHQLGARTIQEVSTTVQRIHSDFQRAAAGAVDAGVVDLEVAGVRLTGRITTRGGRLADSQYSRVDARHLGQAWVQVLAATVAQGRRVDAVLVGRRGPERLVAPPVDLAHTLLGTLVDVARHGTERVLPLPPRVAHRWAVARARGEDPLSDERGLERAWEWDRDEVWRHWFAGAQRPWRVPREPGDPWDAPGETATLGALAALVWAPIVKAQGA